MPRPSPKNKRSGFVCVRCNHHCFERERVFVSTNWCASCVDEETAATPIAQTITVVGQPVALRTRPPSYMLPDANDPVKWRKA